LDLERMTGRRNWGPVEPFRCQRGRCRSERDKPQARSSSALTIWIQRFRPRVCAWSADFLVDPAARRSATQTQAIACTVHFEIWSPPFFLRFPGLGKPAPLDISNQVINLVWIKVMGPVQAYGSMKQHALDATYCRQAFAETMCNLLPGHRFENSMHGHAPRVSRDLSASQKATEATHRLAGMQPRSALTSPMAKAGGSGACQRVVLPTTKAQEVPVSEMQACARSCAPWLVGQGFTTWPVKPENLLFSVAAPGDCPALLSLSKTDGAQMRTEFRSSRVPGLLVAQVCKAQAQLAPLFGAPVLALGFHGAAAPP